MFALYFLYFDWELNCMCVFVCGYAHTHIHSCEVLAREPRGRDETP